MADEVTSAPPSPADDPILWQGFDLGGHHFPADPTQGHALVHVGAKLKVDAKKAAGTDKARTTINGVEPCDFVIELHWTKRIWAPTWSMLAVVNPNGPNKGKPQDIRHPWPNQMHRVMSVLVKSMTDFKILEGGQSYSIKLGADEWNPPPKAVRGKATTTPKTSEQWVHARNPNVGSASSNPTPSGFDGSGGPNGKP